MKPNVCDAHVLITSHNRREKTLNLLKQLTTMTKLNLQIWLVDDGSTDGTYEHIKRLYPMVNLIHGDGNLYWAKGMKKAEQACLFSGIRSEYILMMNDDINIFESKIYNLFQYAREKHVNVVGQFISPTSGSIEYGGLKKQGIHPMNYKLITIIEDEHEPDVFHCNFALIKSEDYFTVGGIDGKFEHAYADFDLAIRLKKFNSKTHIYPEVIGFCEDTTLMEILSKKQKLKILFSKKGRPLKSQYYFLRKHTNSFLLALFFTITPYIKAVLTR